MEKKIIYIGFLTRLLLSIIPLLLFNEFVYGNFDNFKFYQRAISISNLDFSKHYWGDLNSIIFSIFFYIFGPNLILASIITNLFWLASAIVLLEITKILNMSEFNKNLVLIIYCFLPSSLILTSTILREPLQLLLFHIFILFFLRYSFIKNINNFLYLSFSLILLSFTHKAFLIFFFAFIILSMIKKIKLNINKSLLFLFLLFLILILVNFNFLDSLLYKYSDYLEGHRIGRATYTLDINFTNTIDLLSSIFFSFVNFFFRPLPQELQSMADWLMFCENTIRVFLIFSILFYLLFTSDLKNKKITFNLMSIYLLLNLIWSIFTINWGTSVRHHLPSLGLLLIIYFNYKNNEKKNNIFR